MPRPFAVTRFVASARLFRDKTQFVAAFPICKVFCNGDEVVLLQVVVVFLVFFIDVDF